MNEEPSRQPPDKLQPRTELIKAGEGPREAQPPMVLQLGSPDEGSSGAFSFSVLWQALLKRLKLAAPIGVVLAAIACAALWYFTEPKFRSLASLKIIEKQPFVAFPTAESSRDFAQTQIELLRGPFIIGRALETKGLAEIPELREIAGKEDAVLWISQRLKAIQIGKSEIYEVSFTTRHPESARKVVEAIVDTYMEFQTGESDSQRQHLLEVLEEELLLFDRKIELARERLREQSKQATGEDGVVLGTTPGTNGPPTALQGRFALMSSLQQQLVTAEVAAELAKARVKAMKAEIDKDVRVPEGQIEATITADPGVVKLKRDLQNAEDTLRKLNQKSQHYARVQEEVKKLTADLDAKKESLKAQILKDAEEHVRSQRRDVFSAAEADLASKEQTAALLKERIDDERGEQLQSGDKSLELKFAGDELHNVEQVRARVNDRIVQLRTESRALPQVYNIMKAKLPEFPEGPTLVKKLAMVGAAAFFAPFVLLIGWDVAHRRVFEREQLEREFDLRLVSEIAALPTRALVPRPGAEKAYQLQSHLFEESVNSLRTALAVDEQIKDARVFVVASAVSGEGKTNLSSQLAMSWSHAIQGRVVVVDADLRAPNIHDMFEVQSAPGLADILRGTNTLDESLVMDWGDRLFILPAGDIGTSSPAHLFSSPRFRDCIAQLRTRFDKVIIDVPPVLCASETLLIAKEADGVLMCARHDYSRAGQFKQAHDRLVGAGVKVVGAVLNGAPVHKYSYSYRGYAPA